MESEIRAAKSRQASSAFRRDPKGSAFAVRAAEKRSPSGRGETRVARGFTLIEVLVALVLMAILLPVLMHGISLASRAASMSVRKTQAAALASSKLQELVATGQVQSGGMSGDFADEFPGYTWTSQVQEWNPPGVSQQDLSSQNQSLTELDVTVSWTGNKGKQSLTLSTLVYSNAPLGPGASPVTNTQTKKGPSMGNVSGG